MIDTAQLRKLMDRIEPGRIIDDYAILLAKAIYRAGQTESAAEIERLRTLANSSEKWKGIASAKFGDGRTVQQLEEDARQAAYRNVLEEWEKPWGLSGGKTFIDRLRAMIKPSPTAPASDAAHQTTSP